MARVFGVSLPDSMSAVHPSIWGSGEVRSAPLHSSTSLGFGFGAAATPPSNSSINADAAAGTTPRLALSRMSGSRAALLQLRHLEAPTPRNVRDSHFETIVFLAGKAPR